MLMKLEVDLSPTIEQQLAEVVRRIQKPINHPVYLRMIDGLAFSINNWPGIFLEFPDSKANKLPAQVLLNLAGWVSFQISRSDIFLGLIHFLQRCVKYLE
ncbi:hypothetical protein BH739_16315 [Enterococcus casseliflavus]|nr:hypothetical protein BH739_16315 [Enterococcus casseliflavus]